MTLRTSEKYALALSILTRLVDSAFTDLIAEKKKPGSDRNMVEHLQTRFRDYYIRRLLLSAASDSAAERMLATIRYD